MPFDQQIIDPFNDFFVYLDYDTKKRIQDQLDQFKQAFKSDLNQYQILKDNNELINQLKDSPISLKHTNVVSFETNSNKFAIKMELPYHLKNDVINVLLKNQDLYVYSREHEILPELKNYIETLNNHLNLKLANLKSKLIVKLNKPIDQQTNGFSSIHCQYAAYSPEPPDNSIELSEKDSVMICTDKVDNQTNENSSIDDEHRNFIKIESVGTIENESEFDGQLIVDVSQRHKQIEMIDELNISDSIMESCKSDFQSSEEDSTDLGIEKVIEKLSNEIENDPIKSNENLIKDFIIPLQRVNIDDYDLFEPDFSSIRKSDKSHYEDLSDDESKAEVKLYCYCRKPHNNSFMLQCCGSCGEWYHGRCVGLTISEYTKKFAKKKKIWRCPECNRDYEDISEFENEKNSNLTKRLKTKC